MVCEYSAKHIDEFDRRAWKNVSENKLVLRPLIGLMSGLRPEAIERFVIEEIEKYRRLRDEATRLEAQTAEEAKPETSSAHTSAMIAVHAQQTVVSTLLDILGYIPKIPKQRPH